MEDLELLSKEAGRNAITIMLFVDVKTGTEHYFRSINQELLSVFAYEPGVLFFQLSQEVYHPSRFIICKKFRDWDAFQYHLKDPALAPVMQFLQTSIKEPPFEKGYHQLMLLAPL
jgi:quinol monooxygenase YgiN